MACIPGRYSRVQADFGSGYANLPGIVDVTLNGNVDELECTTHDDSVRKYLPNLSDFTLDITLRWDEAEAQQVALRNTLFPTVSTFSLYFMLENTAGKMQIEADAFITNWSPSGPLDDTANLDVSLRLTSVAVGTV